MKYKVTMHEDVLPLAVEVYKKTGGYFEVTPNGDHSVTVISDNEEFLYHDNFKGVKNVTPISLVPDSSDIIREEVMNVLQELFESPTEIKTASGPVAIPSVDVKAQLQRKKIQQNLLLDYAPEGKRTKWELIKALQGEFDKFPDDAVFTGFKAIGIGKFGTRYI